MGRLAIGARTVPLDSEPASYGCHLQNCRKCCQFSVVRAQKNPGLVLAANNLTVPATQPDPICVRVSRKSGKLIGGVERAFSDFPGPSPGSVRKVARMAQPLMRARRVSRLSLIGLPAVLYKMTR